MKRSAKMLLCELIGVAGIAAAEHAYASNNVKTQIASEMLCGCGLLMAGAYASNPDYSFIRNLHDKLKK